MSEIKTVFVGGPIQYAVMHGAFPSMLKDLIESALDTLSASGYRVLSAHRFESYGDMDVTDMEAQVCRRDHNWMKECDCFVAVLPGLSDGQRPFRTDGTHIELGWASAMGKKIVIIRSQNTVYSHLVAGLGSVADVSFIDAVDFSKDPQTLVQIIQNKGRLS